MGFFKGISKIAKPFIGAGLGYATGGPIGGIMGGLSSLGGSGRNPADASMGYLNQIPGMAQGYLNPYAAEGREAYNKLLDQYSNTSTTNPNQFPDEYRQMGRDPNSFMNNLMKGYEPSRGYNYKQNQMLSQARNTAASGGFAGTQYDQANQSELMRDLLGSDMAEYLTNVMGIQNRGLEGEERRLAGRERTLSGRSDQGFRASSDLANILGTNLSEQSRMRYLGERNQNIERARRRDSRMGLFGELLNPENQGAINNANKGLGGLFGSLSGMFGF